MAEGDDDEWEYEYDETETEDFYITLDLSNIPGKGDAAPPKMGIKPSLSGHPIKLQTKLRELDAIRRYEEENAVDASGTSSSMGDMQVTGLHTQNPLIVYNNHLISCSWGSTIGTDMFFVKPNPDAEPAEQPLRSLPAVDLLATSSAKLMGTMATLRPSDDVVEKVTLSEEATEERSQNDRQAVENTGTAAPGVNSNSFLARLNEVKAKRGEKSRLTLSSTPDGNRLVAEDVEMGGTEEQT